MGPKQIFLTSKRFLSKNLVKHTAAILSGNIIAQCIALAIYPLLTRLYTPEDFGLLNVFLSMGGVWVLFATGEYQSSIMLPRSNQRAVSCFQVGFCLTVLVTLVCVLTLPFSSAIAAYFDAPALSQFYFLLPIYVFFVALWSLLTFWYSRQQDFKRIGSYQIYLSINNAAFKTAFSKLPFPGGLVIASSLAPIIAIFASLGKKTKSVWLELTKFSKKSFWAVARRYKNFPLFSLPRAVLIYLGCNLPYFVLTPVFGLTEMGWFGMGITLAFTPINMIVAAMYKVLFQRISAMIQNKQVIGPFLLKVMGKVALVILPGFVLLYFVLPSFTAWLLGAEWEQTGHYIQYMLPWLWIMLLSGTMDFIPDLFLRQRSMFVIEIIGLLARLGALFVGIYFQSVELSILGYFLVAALVCIVELLWIIYLVNQYDKNRECEGYCRK